MTRQRYDDHSTEFGLWIREFGPDSKRDGLDVENLDYVLFNYITGDLALLEEKRYKAKPTKAQWDTLCVIDQLIRNGVNTGKPVKTMRGWREIKYHGLHLLRFENTTPDDGWIEFDGKKISKEELLRFLKFKWTNIIPFPHPENKFEQLKQQVEQLKDKLSQLEGELSQAKKENEMLKIVLQAETEKQNMKKKKNDKEGSKYASLSFW